MIDRSAPVGLVLGSELPPEELATAAAAAEQQGFSHLWLAEDYFFTGGISGAGIALAATETIPVGLGVVSAMTRHPALLAMEIATLARAYEGRVRPAVGLGVPAWLAQMGIAPRSPLSELRGCVTGLRSLLAGEQLDGAYGSFEYDGVQLTYPLATPVPIATGVIGPKMLELSGEVADATLLSVLVGESYVRWARARIAAGAMNSGRDGAVHEVTAFAIYHVDPDRETARAALRDTVAFYLAAGGENAITREAGISEPLAQMIARGGVDTVAAEMPDEWLDALTVCGTPEDCTAGIQRLLDAGADSVALFPIPSETFGRQTELTSTEVLPALTRS
jgi:5,10-methylenetetrahydromethanopterin reductase